jgi:hypothetical protein
VSATIPAPAALRPGALQIDIEECEAMVSDLTHAIDDLLEEMLMGESTRNALVGTLMKVVNARYLIKDKIATATKDEGSEAQP